MTSLSISGARQATIGREIIACDQCLDYLAQQETIMAVLVRYGERMAWAAERSELAPLVDETASSAAGGKRVWRVTAP